MAYQIRLFNKNEDKNTLFSLWGEKSEKNLQRRFEYMYGARARGQIKTSLLFDEKSQDIFGCLSLFTHKIRMKDDNFKLGINCDMFVKKEHRLLGPAVILLKSLIKDAREDGYQALLAMPNKMSAPVFQRVGYACIGDLYRWVKIIKFEDKLAVKIKPKALLKIISKAFDFFFEFFSWEWVWRISYFLAKGRFKAQEIEFNEINFDEHLRKIGIFEKPPEYIEWRYYGMDNNDSKMFALTRNGLTAGLMIYYVRGQDVILQDILIPKSLWAMKIMLSAFMHKMRARKMKSISVLFLGRGKMMKFLQSFGFLRRESRSLYLHTFDQKFESNFADKYGLDLFEGDLDL